MTVPRLRHWTIDVALRYWADHVLDREHHGFLNRICADGGPVPGDPKTALTQARCLYTYAHAMTLGAGPWAREAADSCKTFLVRHMWDDRAGGWRTRTGRDGTADDSVADGFKDAYDQGFILLSMAWYHKATGDPEALVWARKTMDFIDAVLADPEFGGYHERTWTEGEDYPLPRRQNPHMHLLEGLLAMFEVTGEREWIDRAAGIVDLLRTRFRDPATGTLREFMGRDWSDYPAPRGLIREPGHHMEWTWLLLHYRRLSGDDSVLPIADFLYGFAIRHGWETNPSLPFAAYDEVMADGTPLQTAKLLWPQTEALKAYLARWEFLGDEDAKQRAWRVLETLFGTYVDVETGVWRNRISREGEILEAEAPTRLLYHLYMALGEAIRVMPEWSD